MSKENKEIHFLLWHFHVFSKYTWDESLKHRKRKKTTVLLQLIVKEYGFKL